MTDDKNNRHSHGDHSHDHTHDHAHAHKHGHNSLENVIDGLEADLKVASTILEWESGDIFGHVGVRLPSDEGVACKAFRPAGSEDEDWLVHFDFNGKKLSGNGTPPMEYAIYTEIFRLRPDAKAVVHTHSPACVALSLADKQISAIHMQSAKFGYGVPIYPRPIHIKDKDEGDELARMLDAGNAIIIKGHGVVTTGKNIDEACMNALYLERTAKIQGMAMSLGFKGPTKEFMDEILESRRRLMSLPDNQVGKAARGGYSNEWSYYRNLIARGERWTRGWS